MEIKPYQLRGTEILSPAEVQPLGADGGQGPRLGFGFGGITGSDPLVSPADALSSSTCFTGVQWLPAALSDAKEQVQFPENRGTIPNNESREQSPVLVLTQLQLQFCLQSKSFDFQSIVLHVIVASQVTARWDFLLYLITIFFPSLIHLSLIYSCQ